MKALDLKKYPHLFYFWGHSTEFEKQNNWKLLEEFCKKATASDEIWFATNMEIYEYTNAYFSLVFSADEKMVYNPTLLTVWFKMDDKLYHIAFGETKVL